MRSPICMLSIAGAILLALPLAAPVHAAGSDIPITDPDLLERLGFDPDTEGIYAAEDALPNLLMSPAEHDALQKTLQARDMHAASAGPFGTATAGFTSFGAYAFRPYRSEIEYGPRTTALRGMTCRDLRVGNVVPRFVVELEGLPHGAKLHRVHFWVTDSHATEDVTMSVYRTCYPDDGPANGINTLIGLRETAGAEGATYIAVPSSLGSLNQDVDAQSCVYRLWVDLGGTGTCDPNDLVVWKATAEWNRQISPAPGTATFDDVPTGHLFYQHIEALAASGITGGCGNGNNFCPDSPLTRGQMAAFLATALGLHWGEISQ